MPTARHLALFNAFSEDRVSDRKFHTFQRLPRHLSLFSGGMGLAQPHGIDNDKRE
jgi:hypothetical protein